MSEMRTIGSVIENNGALWNDVSHHHLMLMNGYTINEIKKLLPTTFFEQLQILNNYIFTTDSQEGKSDREWVKRCYLPNITEYCELPEAKNIVVNENGFINNAGYRIHQRPYLFFIADKNLIQFLQTKYTGDLRYMFFSIPFNPPYRRISLTENDIRLFSDENPTTYYEVTNTRYGLAETNLFPGNLYEELDTFLNGIETFHSSKIDENDVTSACVIGKDFEDDPEFLTTLINYIKAYSV